MNKPDSLRAKFVAVFPELGRDPNRLRLWIEEGHVRCHAADPTQGENLNFALEYRLTVVIEEWTRPSLLIWIVLLDWLTVNEPGLLTPAKSKESLPFEADLISSEKADLSFDLMLTERVKATRRADGGFDMELVGEPDPLFPDTVPIEPQGAPLRSIWLDGSQLVPDALDAA